MNLDMKGFEEGVLETLGSGYRPEEAVIERLSEAIRQEVSPERRKTLWVSLW